MASYSIPTLPEDERSITAEDGWKLYESLHGSLQDAYAKLGGSEAFHHSEAAQWNDSPRSK